MTKQNINEFFEKTPKYAGAVVDFLKRLTPKPPSVEQGKQALTPFKDKESWVDTFIKKGAETTTPNKTPSLPTPDASPPLEFPAPSQTPNVPAVRPQTQPISPVEMPNVPSTSSQTQTSVQAQPQSQPKLQIDTNVPKITQTALDQKNRTRKKSDGGHYPIQQTHSEKIKLDPAAILRGDTAAVIDQKTKQYKASSYNNINRIRTQNTRELSTLPTFINQSYDPLQSKPHEIGTDEIVKAYSQATPGQAHHKKLKTFRIYYEEKCNPK